MAELMDGAAEPTAIAGHFKSLGRLAATVHNQAVGWPVPASFERHSLDADGLLGEAPWWGRFWEARGLTNIARERLSKLRENVYACLLGYPKGRDSYSLIHSDLHPGNVLIHADTLSIIDFDDAGFGWHGYELAVALYRYLDDPDFPRYRDALLSGYASTRGLPESIVEQMSVFQVARTLQTIGWVNDRPELNKDDSIPVLADKAWQLARGIGLA